MDYGDYLLSNLYKGEKMILKLLLLNLIPGILAYFFILFLDSSDKPTKKQYVEFSGFIPAGVFGIIILLTIWIGGKYVKR